MIDIHKSFKKHQQTGYDIFNAKNQDYGNHFLNYTYEGAYHDLLRKWERIEKIMEKDKKIKFENETLQDTLIDLANYCYLTCIFLENKKENKIRKIEKNIKIELGGGRNPKPGYKNVDIIPEADFQCNLEFDNLPFENETINEIYTHHTFEHIENIIKVMNECWRVLKFGGKMIVVVPHLNCTLAWQDPTHKRYWNEESMKFFCGKYLKKYKLDYGIKCCFRLIKNKVTIPDNRPKYFKEIEFILEKDKEYLNKVDYNLIK